MIIDNVSDTYLNFLTRMDESRRLLIDAVLSSATLAGKDLKNREILRYLAEHPDRKQRDLRTERAIKAKFFGPDSGTRVSVFLARLQHSLDEYFDNEGAGHEHRIRIIRGTVSQPRPLDLNALEYVPNRDEVFTRRFWLPHLVNPVPSLIVYGEPLFVRNPKQSVFVRDVGKNVPSSIVNALQKIDLPVVGHTGPVRLRGMEVCWPYVTLGDVLCTVDLTRWLSIRKVQTRLSGCQADSKLGDLLTPGTEEVNVIAIGSTRLNGILHHYHDHPPSLPFQLTTWEVVKIGESGRPVGSRIGETRKGKITVVPVIISRRKGVRLNSVTMIASNHGRAVHRVGEVLTDEQRMGELFSDKRLQAWGRNLPDRFQILLQVEVFDHETSAGRHWIKEVWHSDGS